MFFELCISPGKTGFDVLVVKLFIDDRFDKMSLSITAIRKSHIRRRNFGRICKQLPGRYMKKITFVQIFFPYFHCDIVSVNNRSFVYIVTRTSDYQVIVPALRFAILIRTEIDPDSSQTIRICFIQYNERIVHTPIKNHFPVV